MADTADYEKLLSRERSDRDTSPPPARTSRQKNKSIVERLSIYNIAVLGLGTVAILVACGFLTFLWTGTRRARQGNRYPRLWFMIVKNLWADKVVTLCTVLIRFACTAQLAVLAAMLAALILEREAAIADIPLLSIIRCSNTGPQSLYNHVFRSFYMGSHFGYTSIIVITIVTAFIMQFTSTILLTDFGTTTLLKPMDTVEFPFGFREMTNDTNVAAGVDFWTSGPATYPRFAEYVGNGTEGKGYIDTGKTYRGFLPFNSFFERELLTYYEGPMTIMDARILCVKPKLSNLTLSFDTFRPVLSGILRVNGIHPELKQNDGESSEFTCDVADIELDYNKSYWNISLCSILLETQFFGGILSSDGSSGGVVYRVQLLLNTTIHGDIQIQSHESSIPLQVSQQDSLDSSWLRFGYENITLDGSLCVFNPEPKDYIVTVSGIWPEEESREKMIEWDDHQRIYKTDDIRVLYGASNTQLTLKERGVFELENVSNWIDTWTQQVDKPRTVSFLGWTYEKMGGISSQSVLTTFNLAGKPGEASHRTHTAIMQHILQDTRNPALALQTLYTILLQMAYYDFYPQFNVNGTATYQLSTNLDLPISWFGFNIIMSLLVVHFLSMFTVLYLFIKNTKVSFLGNAWQAVSQVSAPDTTDAIQYGAGATDDEVDRTVKGRARISTNVSSGRAEVTYLRKR